MTTSRKGPGGEVFPTARIKIYEHESPTFTKEISETLELGRQDPSRNEPEPYQTVVNADTNQCRLIVAKYNETSVSRQHALLKPVSPYTVSVTAIRSEVTLEDGSVLRPGESRTVSVPHLLVLGTKPVRIEAPPRDDDVLPDSGLHSLAAPTIAPGQRLSEPSLLKQVLADRDEQIDYQTMIACLRSTIEVFEQVVSSPNFLPDSAATMLDIVDVDFAAVLLRNNGQWHKEAVYDRRGPINPELWDPSRKILNELLEQKHTLRYSPKDGQLERQATESLMDVRALVAAPILDHAGHVVGALYGDRRTALGGSGLPEISEVEANLVELIACGVSAGLARLEKEREATEARVKFEEFFTPELARQLEADRNLLQGRAAHVTVLFCDIRGFSGISERIGAQMTLDWIGDVLGDLSQCVLDAGGVLVDYIGDELLAMWGAPVECADHADRACQAARDMLAALSTINGRWEAKIGGETRVGIGINSGVAHVGNTGSRCKFKYGPLGNTVNLASRIQGATKHVKASPLLTHFSVQALQEEQVLRRLCSVRVVNIEEPVQLYELVDDRLEGSLQLRTEYEEALDGFEQGNFRLAAQQLGSLLNDFPSDGPTLGLLSRVVNAMADGPSPMHPVWVLSGK